MEMNETDRKEMNDSSMDPKGTEAGDEKVKPAGSCSFHSAEGNEPEQKETSAAEERATSEEGASAERKASAEADGNAEEKRSEGKPRTEAAEEQKAGETGSAGPAPESSEDTIKKEDEGKGSSSSEDAKEDFIDLTGEALDADFEPVQQEKRGFFRKKKDKKDEQIEALTERVQRQLAEFDNFRKRTEKEKTQMYGTGARDVVEKILPVVDNFERGLASAPENDPFAEGMKQIYRQLMKQLEDLGVHPIEAEGKEFDPNLHNAVMHVEDDAVGENIVVQELQKGYRYGDIIVRHSMVKVAN